MHRKDILEKGIALTTGDRNKEYGEPIDNFTNVGMLHTAYLQAKYGATFTLTPEDVAHMMVLTKMGRTFIGSPKEDTYVDQATYSAIAGEVATKAQGSAHRIVATFLGAHEEESE